MQLSLLTTKFHIQPIRREMVRRQILVEKLTAGLNRKLTLISAPAGFGKSTLASEWVQMVPEGNGPADVAWLSLDEKDNDYVRFLSYFVGALQSADPGKDDRNFGKTTLELLGQNQTAPPEFVVTPLLNQIAVLSRKTILVLDDYHLIENESIHQLIAFLVEHIPESMHLVILTRQDPPLPLPRLRARGEMTEIRAADLRFSPPEITTFMGQTMGLELSDNDISTLATRTEGWAAGLQLAGVSLKGSNDVSAAIKSFAGSNRHVTDYLLQEVLSRQNPQVQDFLLRTSILDQLSGALCNTIMEQENGQQMIEALEQANLFILPLDNERRWYRYHHLFRELLQKELQQVDVGKIPNLHLLASKWFESERMWPEAINHGLAAGNDERVADLAEWAWPDWNKAYRAITWLSWIEDLPAQTIRRRPVLSTSIAFAYLNAGRLEDAESRLVDAERCLDSANSFEPIFVDKKQFQVLPAWIASVRGYHAQATGNVDATVVYVKQVLDLLPEDDYLQQDSATALLGLAYWSGGNLESAHKTFSGGVFRTDEDRIIGTFVLADIKLSLGFLRDAISTVEFALRLTAGFGTPKPSGTEDLYTAYGELQRERGNLQAAEESLNKARELGEQVELPDWQYRWYIARARLNETLGNLPSALEMLEEAERVFIRTPLPVVRPIGAMKARIWVRQGRLNEAISWMREQNLRTSDELIFLNEFEHLVLARILIAGLIADDRTNSDDVIGLLNRLQIAAENGKRVRSLIEILILLALVYHIKKLDDLALEQLENALVLAEAEGFAQLFLDEGDNLARLLRKVAAKGITPLFTKVLLDTIHDSDAKQIPGLTDMAEPLSERETEVLVLIGEGLSNDELGARLFISPHTAKTHTRTIYAKLDVHNRIGAIAKARNLGIL